MYVACLYREGFTCRKQRLRTAATAAAAATAASKQQQAAASSSKQQQASSKQAASKQAASSNTIPVQAVQRHKRRDTKPRTDSRIISSRAHHGSPCRTPPPPPLVPTWLWSFIQQQEEGEPIHLDKLISSGRSTTPVWACRRRRQQQQEEVSSPGGPPAFRGFPVDLGGLLCDREQLLPEVRPQGFTHVMHGRRGRGVGGVLFLKTGRTPARQSSWGPIHAR